jgi:hypothetical protein
MLDQVNLANGTAVGSTALGMVGVVTAQDLSQTGLSIVAVIGGLLSLIMAAYGNYRKINKEYGVDDIKAANAKIDALASQNEKLNAITVQQSADMLELLKAQNQLLAKLNAHTETVAVSTAVSADLAAQQAAKTNT